MSAAMSSDLIPSDLIREKKASSSCWLNTLSRDNIGTACLTFENNSLA